MADSIDQNSLPGVKEVCRDFTVLEDQTLAHSLQEQEIESHLASNVHRNRLVQQDLRVAKRLQEEEDLRTRVRMRQLHRTIEQSDSEIAMEIQEQLVWQARQLRQQEEKDEAIARKLQEKEMKERRKRKKQEGFAFEDGLYENQGEMPTLDPLEASLDRQRFSRGSSRRQQNSLEPGAAQQKEKPLRPPPPQWDRSKEADSVADPEGERDGFPARDMARDNYPLMANDVYGRAPHPSRAYVGWEHAAHNSGRARRQLSNGQQSSPMARRRHSWEPQGTVPISGVDPSAGRGLSRSSRGPDWNELEESDMMQLTQGMDHLDLQEVRDMEVARRLQEEELIAHKINKRAAQVAQDEEIAWLIMEEEEKNYKKCRDLEETPPRGHRKLSTEKIPRPLMQDQCQKSRTWRPDRPPAPPISCENVESTSLPSRSPRSTQAPARPGTSLKGSFYRQ